MPPPKKEFEEIKNEVESLNIRPSDLLKAKAEERKYGPSPPKEHELKPEARNRKRKISKPKSYERARQERSRECNREPLSPVDSDGGRPRVPSPPPFMFSPPLSPTTFSATSFPSSMDRDVGEHWAKQIMTDTTSTMLPVTLEPSQYHEGAHRPECNIPDERYEVGMALSFPPELVASFHYPIEDDSRAKMLVNQPSRRGPVMRSMPLKALHLHRSGSVLRFYYLRDDDEKTRVPWVSLQFTTIERLVLFANTFVAMRTFSGTKPESSMLWDDHFGDEVKEYQGEIYDPKYKYKLYIYRDRPSKAVRLQACKLGGTYDRTPVWTAFVTHQITSPSWCQQIQRKEVFLHELRLHVFRSRYGLERSPSGAHILRFTSSSDALSFVAAVTRLREKITRPPPPRR